MAVTAEISIIDTIKENRWSAEFFDPKYSFEPTNKYKWSRIGNLLKRCQYGISISMNETQNGYPIFRMNEIDNCFLTEAAKYAAISRTEFLAFKLSCNDILFNRTNSFDFVGRTGILKEETDSVFASYLIRVNPNEEYILPEFLTIYLNTPFGIGQIKRRAMHSINQANVSASELKRILIPVIGIHLQQEIADIVNEAFKLKKNSESLYAQAEQLLEQELGLDKIQFENPIAYETSFSSVTQSKRGDAEFHNPELRHYYNLLSKSYQLNPITNYSQVMKFGNPDYSDVGLPIITQKHLQKITPKNYGDDLLADMRWIQKYPLSILRNNDLLFYSVGAYLGKTNIWLNQDDEAVPASFITLLRAFNDYDAGYLMVLLNTKYGILQSKVFQSGTSQQYIYPKDIRQFQIPDISVGLRRDISKMIIDSYNAETKSQELLEKAKNRVEELIEQGVN